MLDIVPETFSFSISFDMDPVGKKRHRHRVFENKVFLYSDQKKLEAEIKKKMSNRLELLTKSDIDFMKNSPFVEVNFLMLFPLKKSYSKTQCERMLAGIERPVKKPDIDNVQKLFLDCANTIFYKDDCCVTDSAQKKRYAKQGKVIMNLTYFRYKV